MNNANDTAALRNPPASELPALLTELEHSGLGVAAFARARGLKPQKLYLARRRRKRKDTPATIFDPVRVSGLGLTQAPFQLNLSSGHKLSGPSDFESSALRRLLEVLGAC